MLLFLDVQVEDTVDIMIVASSLEGGLSYSLIITHLIFWSLCTDQAFG